MSEPRWKIHNSQEDGVLIYLGQRRPVSERDYLFHLIDGARHDEAVKLISELNEISALKEKLRVVVEYLEKIDARYETADYSQMGELQILAQEALAAIREKGEK